MCQWADRIDHVFLHAHSKAFFGILYKVKKKKKKKYVYNITQNPVISLHNHDGGMANFGSPYKSYACSEMKNTIVYREIHCVTR